ncbi:hypothetical protein PM082_002256 [Marasmius tenuissimus]|nr:hypothetical protein PM082_002256 [Marasmius tenuissimus]
MGCNDHRSAPAEQSISHSSFSAALLNLAAIEDLDQSEEISKRATGARSMKVSIAPKNPPAIDAQTMGTGEPARDHITTRPVDISLLEAARS